MLLLPSCYQAQPATAWVLIPLPGSQRCITLDAPFTFVLAINLQIYDGSFLAGDSASFKEGAAKGSWGLVAGLPLPNPHRSPSQPRGERGTRAYVTYALSN